MRRAPLKALIAALAALLFGLAVIAWRDSKTPFIHDWFPSLATSLLSVALLTTLLQWLFDRQERNRLRPLVGSAIENALAPFAACLLERWLTERALATGVAPYEAGLKVTDRPPQTIEELCKWWDGDLEAWISREQNPQMATPPYQAIVDSLEPLRMELRAVSDRYATVLDHDLRQALNQAVEGLQGEGGADTISQKMSSFRPLFDGGGPNEGSLLDDMRGVARDLVNLARAYENWAGQRLLIHEGSRLEAKRRLTPTPTQESRLLAQQHHPRAPNPGSIRKR
jgi:hypothetical protein